jgi:hypothetical protein
MSGRNQWIEHSDILQNVKIISQTKLNRVLRRFFFDDVQSRAAFFSIRLFQPSDIKKVKWAC